MNVPEFIIKNLGNIGLLVFSFGIWFDTLFGLKEEGRFFSPPSIVIIAVGAAAVTVYLVMRARAKRAAETEKNSDEEEQ
jgi:hypothetical protein